MPRSTASKRASAKKEEASPLKDEKDPESTPPADNNKSLAELYPTPALASTSLRMSYRIARGEQGVLTFEPYKSYLLPHWRFKTAAIALASSRALHGAFAHYVHSGDFVGADMARKFIQMGMTRAKRYANHKGGRKYDRSAREVERDGGGRVELPKSAGHQGREEKLRASEIFRELWRSCVEDARYVELKGGFMKELKEWEKGAKNDGGEGTMKMEEAEKEVKKEEVEDG